MQELELNSVLTSSSHTDSKYLSRVSTRLWMNSKTANSFWNKEKNMKYENRKTTLKKWNIKVCRKVKV